MAGLDLERALSSIVDGMATTLTISAAARAAGIRAHTLRYYERAGLLDPVGRAASGHRRYADEDLARIEFLTKLRSTGMPIRKVREYADLMRRGDETHGSRPGVLPGPPEGAGTPPRDTGSHS